MAPAEGRILLAPMAHTSLEAKEGAERDPNCSRHDGSQADDGAGDARSGDELARKGCAIGAARHQQRIVQGNASRILGQQHWQEQQCMAVASAVGGGAVTVSKGWSHTAQCLW